MTAILWLPLALAGGGVLAELLARAVYRGRGRWLVQVPHTRLRMEIDTDALPRVDPVAWLKVNASGERGATLPTTPADPHLYRVLVAGGSAAECWCLDQDDAWPGHLHQLLQERAAKATLDRPHVHVGSIARSLASADTVAWILDRVLPSYPRVDCLVIMAGASDLIRWLQDAAPAAWDATLPPPDDVFAEFPSRRFTWTVNGSALRHGVAALHRRVRAPVRTRTGVGGVYARLREKRARAETTLTDVRDPSVLLEPFEKAFRRMIRVARSRGGPDMRLVLVQQPWLHEPLTDEQHAACWNFAVGRPFTEETTVYYSLDLVQELSARVDAVARRVAEEEGAEWVQLLGRLECSLENFFDFNHFTSEGSRRVARIVAEHILNGGTEPEFEDESLVEEVQS